MQQDLENMRVEVAELRASLKRLLAATDADRRLVERELHDGVHQHLIALAVSLQLAGQAVDSDAAAAKTLLEEMGRDVQQALEEAAKLALRIYPPTLDVGDLGPLLRSAAVSAGVPASVDVATLSNHSPEVLLTLYLCWLNVLARANADTRSRIVVTENDNALEFELLGSSASTEADVEYVRNRVDALGGELAVVAASGGGTRISGSLPLSR